MSFAKLIAVLLAASFLPAMAEPILDAFPDGPLVSGYLKEGAAARLDAELRDSGSKMVYVSDISYSSLDEVVKIRNVIKSHGASTAAIEEACTNFCWPILAAGKERFVRPGQLIGITWFGNSIDWDLKANLLQTDTLKELAVADDDIRVFWSSLKHRTYFFQSERAVESHLVTEVWAGPLPQSVQDELIPYYARQKSTQ